MPIPSGSAEQSVVGQASGLPRDARPSGGLWLAGIVLLAISILGAGAMSWAKLKGISLPGCGAGSACAGIAAGKWGSIPIGGIRWPVSYLGLAYFSALLAAWIVTRGAFGVAMRWVVAIGALASAAFVGIMLGNDKGLCRYCMITHLGNFGFLALLALSAGGTVAGLNLRPLRGGAVLAGLFVLMTVGLAVADSAVRSEVQQQAAREREESLADIQRRNEALAASRAAQQPAQPTQAASTQQAAQQNQTQPPAPQPPEQQASQSPQAPAAPPAVQTVSTSTPKGFTGRWRFGPEKAGVRIVMFTGYQCPDCQRVDGQLEGLLRKYPNISLSIKHFPFCKDCNPHAPNLHGNACWAARAAETAGMMGGAEAFRKMHRWLFEKKGEFTNRQELSEGILRAGLNVDRFLEIMQSDAPLKNIQADIDEAMGLGIGSTPFIFINGVELKGWHQKPTSVQETVEALAISKPEEAGPEGDRPPRAFAKFIADWREERQMAWPSRQQPYAIGPITAKVKITVFGDLLEPYTAEADRAIRDYILGRTDVRYEFRYYPVDPACNPGVPAITKGCGAAKAAEAAGQMGGDAAYWAMHDWITANQKSFSDAGIRQVATSLGLDADALASKMESAEVGQVVALDVDIGKRIGIPSIPRVFVNGKLVPRWQLPGGGVLESIIEEATKDAPQPVTPVDPVQNNPILRQLQR